MSYSDEIPRPQKKNVRGQAANVRQAAEPLFQPPTPVDPDPAPIPDVRPPANGQMPQPRQAASVPAQAQTPPPRQPQQAPKQGNIALAPAQQRQQPAPPQQQAVPQQRQQQPPPQRKQAAPAQQRQQPAGPARERLVAPAQKAPAQPQQQAQPQAQKTPASTISVGEERPSAPIDRSTVEFASGSTGGKADPKDLLLDTEGLVKIYDGRTVVNGVNINVKRGEIVGLLGPNGAGKTTSFYMMVGLVPPNGGRVIFDGKDVTKYPMYKRARLGMGYLPQEESIFRKLTVEENIMAVMQTMKYSRKEKKAKCEELLERFSITHIRKNIAMACSGGEKRRVTIARSLVPDPSLIMLDEPFGGVDPIAVGEIQGIVKDLRKEGLAVLITDHNARETLDLVDRAYLICEGKVLREGPKEFLVNDPVSRQLYLGERFSM